jgi:hypothetical protein
MNGHRITRIDHDAARARFSGLLDGVLGAAEAAQVAAHLEQCAACRSALEQLTATVTLLRGVEPVQVPEGFAAAVRGRIEHLEATTPRTYWTRLRDFVPNIRWSWKTAAAAASLAIVAIFAANLAREIVPGTFRERGPGGRPDLARDETARKSVQAPSALAPSGAETREAESNRAAQGIAPPADAIPLRRVIRTGAVAIEVEKFEETARRVLSIAEAAGGFVADSSYVEEEGRPRGSFVLRVPASRFSEVVRQVETLGTVQRRQIGGQDVTEEFIDIEARVRNLERQEARLLTFMDRATKIPDLMAVEQEVGRVRGEIERLTGRLRLLANRVEFATIQAEVTQKRRKSSGFWDFEQTLTRIQTAFLNTVRQLLGVVEGLAAFAAALVPVVLLGAIGWSLLRRAMRRADRTV